MSHINIFETKTDEELVKLYDQFREVEKTGFFDKNELGAIVEKYREEFGAKTLIMLQIEITHAVADRWYKEFKTREENEKEYEEYLRLKRKYEPETDAEYDNLLNPFSNVEYFDYPQLRRNHED